MPNSNNTNITCGPGFGGLLALLFIGLKLGGVIDWSWWWVLSPLWIPVVVVLGIVAAILLFAGLVWCLAAIFESKPKKSGWRQIK